MHYRKISNFFLNLSTLFNLIIHVSSLLDKANDVRGLDVGQLAEASYFDQEELIRPVDRHLVQQEHLNTWRHLRTIEVVVRKNKSFQTYKRTLEIVVKDMFDNPNIHAREIDRIPQRAEAWARYKPNKPLAMVVYYLIEVLKHQSSQLQVDKEELHRLTDRLIEETNFPPNSLESCIVTPFLDAVMSELSLHMLLDQFGKATIADQVHSSNYLSVEGTLVWKKMILQTDHLEYIKHYQSYMKLIEIFDILAAAVIQDKNLICNHLTPSLSRSLPKIRTLLENHSANPKQLHRYLINRTPYDHNRPLTIPIFRHPAELDSGGSPQLEENIHKLWILSDNKDSKISSRLLWLSDKIADDSHKPPRYICRIAGFKSLKQTAKDGSLRHRQMLNHISRTINLVLDLEDDDFEARTVLFEILQSALRTLPMQSDPRESEKRMENCVMFYLLIRRIARVLEVVIKKELSPTIPDGKNIKAKIMMYYWSMLSFIPSTLKLRHKETFEWFSFGLGRVYLDHLQSSVTLNKLYEQMSLVQKNGPIDQSPISIQVDKLDPDQDELNEIPVKFKKQSPKRYKNKSQKRKKSYAYSDGDEDYNPKLFATSFDTQATVQGKRFDEDIKDRLNFKIPKRKSSRHPSVLFEKNVSDEQVKAPYDKKSYVIDGETGSTRDFLMAFKKRHRTKTCKGISLEHQQINVPNMARKQNSETHQPESVQEEKGRKDSIQMTGSEPNSSGKMLLKSNKQRLKKNN
ncbi:uncharacterized protein MELLADRAFT_107552 [Melampsora larici-populina 98AG31]|uniref:Timeless N-terminal domain-containing protein n=1 Tax=Melampsora larici-populina (strain 98AG31 / pathotype 3-4-7) TaxID=747676 RepID=F4RQM8_MELLP|nr:uncharacterized protein MELLADRAFT_107552 [Melampsora larici-populina 98AG31]EGG05485.1 hypothetical protein MELLADRAFT_107552 [Melampsora larici-populina 98AG31]